MAVFRGLSGAIGTSTGNYLNYSLSRNGLLFYQPCATLRIRSIEKKLGIPPRPKRPAGPFIKFSVEQRPLIMEENPSLPAKDVLKEVANRWKKVSPEEKEELRKGYMRNLEDYTKEVMAYEQNLTVEQKREIKAEKFKAIETSEKNKMKSRLKELGKPKKPPTTFILYMLSRVHTKAKDVKFSDWLSVAANEWNEASDETKKKVEKESAKLMEKYKKEMIDWEQKMIKLGNIDVVRKQVLLDLKGKSSPSNE